MRFKKCKNCGMINLSKHEFKILKYLPITAKTLGKKLNISRKQAHVELTRLEKLKIVNRQGYDGKSIIFDRGGSGFCQLDTIVGLPISSNAQIKWSKQKPDKPGWWWSKTIWSEEKCQEVVIIEIKQDQFHKFYYEIDEYHSIYLDEDLAKHVEYWWAGPIPEPVE